MTDLVIFPEKLSVLRRRGKGTDSACGVNEILKREDSPLFDGIADGTNYYFVHSYHFRVANEKNIATVTPYCGEFVSSVIKDNIVGTQFHPEKSQKAGFKLIKNFLSM